jgi:hypothetical protein
MKALHFCGAFRYSQASHITKTKLYFTPNFARHLLHFTLTLLTALQTKAVTTFFITANTTKL